MRKVRWALVGLDHWYTASTLLSQTETPHAALKGAWHHDKAMISRIASQPAEWRPTWEELVDDPEVELVVSCCHTRLNQEVLEAAIERGKHVISVKPMAMDLDTAEELVDRAAARGVLFMSFESSGRLSALNQAIKDVVQSQWFGPVYSFTGIVHSRLPARFPGAEDAGWWIDPDKVPGGGWIDHAIYHIDLYRWLTGAEFTSVTGIIANVKHKDVALEDFGASVYTTTSGAVVNLQHTWHVRKAGPGHTMIEIVGEGGSVLFDSTQGALIVTDESRGEWRRVEVPQGRGSLVDHAAAVALGVAQPVASGNDSLRNLRACLAFYQAVRAGTVVGIGE